MSDNDNSGAFLTGFIIGGLVGAAAALLWTPQSGEKTRVQIRERGIELKTQFGDVTTELQERSKGVIKEQLRGSDAAAETPPSEDEPIADEEPAADDTA